jgi:8-oxo-dGTP pyrophosphatase MutT (NUDIX family)
MTHVDASLLAPIVRRFGHPAEWRPTVHLTEHDAAVMRLTRSGREHDVTFAVRRADGMLAVIRKPSFPPGAWRVPSGGVARDEAFLDGVRREALEELGIDLELTGYPLVARCRFEYADGRRQRWTTHVVTARPVPGDAALAPRDAREIAAARWMGMDELTGPVAGVLRAGPGALFRYRAELHDRLAGLLAAGDARTVEA